MPEPDSPNDLVYYERMMLHYPQGLDMEGPIFANKMPVGEPPLLVPGQWFPLNNVAGSLTSASWADGSVPWGTIYLPEDMAIVETAFEVVTTIGSAGAVNRVVFYKDDGSGRAPGELIHAGTQVSVETIGIKTQAAVVTLPKGLLWFSVVPQGGATTRATIRASIDQHRRMSIPSAGRMLSIPLSSGMTGAPPANAPAI